MAAVPETQIQLLSRQEVAEVVLDKALTNQLFRILPFVPIEGYELKLAGVDASISLEGLADVETEGGSLNSTAPTLVSRTFLLSRLSAVLEVNTITQDKYSDKSNVLQTLIDLKSRGIRDLFCRLLYAGDVANAGEFDGLKNHCSVYSQLMSASGGAGGTVDRGELEQLRSMVQVDQPAAEVYLVMHAKAYKHLLTVNYSDVEFVAHPVLGTLPSLGGIPILIDNFISTSEGAGSDETTIYCIALGRGVGLTGITPASLHGEEIRVRGPITSDSAGVMSYQISWDVGIAVWNKGGIAAMSAVKYGNTA